MKKLTAGIFTVLMGLVSVNAADAAVASKGYVDAVAKTKANADNVYTKSETESLLNEKATKATTLAGYGITDAYTKEDVDKTFETIENVKTKVQAVIDSLGSSGGEGGEGATGLQATVLKNQQDIVDLKATTSQHGEKIEALETLTGTNGQIAQNITKALDDAKDYTDEKVGALTSETGAITQNATAISTLQGLVGDKSVDSQIDTKINALKLTENYETKGAAGTALTEAKAYTDDLANGQVKTNKEAIEAINDGTNGILAQAKADATEKANTAESNAKTYAKTYTDQKVSGLNLQDIARVPAACSNADNYCTLTTNGTQFVWEVIARDGTEDTAEPSTTPGSERLIVTPATIVEPTVTQ